MKPITLAMAEQLTHQMELMLASCCSLEEAMLIVGTLYSNMSKALNLPHETAMELQNKFLAAIQMPIEIAVNGPKATA